VPPWGDITKSKSCGDGAPVQLRYRSEMADLFADLAIGVGLGDVELLAEARALMYRHCRRSPAENSANRSGAGWLR
jgi:hypothetical protein